MEQKNKTSCLYYYKKLAAVQELTPRQQEKYEELLKNVHPKPEKTKEDIVKSIEINRANTKRRYHEKDSKSRKILNLKNNIRRYNKMEQLTTKQQTRLEELKKELEAVVAEEESEEV